MFARLIEKNNVPSAPISMKERQAPLLRRYASDPDAAWIVDGARTSSENVASHMPIYTEVTAGIGIPATLSIGVHKAVGGNSDHPNPGEILSAALAACLDTTIRIVANHLGVRLTRLSVNVDARVDVRGTLRADRKVPVGFQHIDVTVDIETGDNTSPNELAILLKAAEKSCVVLQTLRQPPPVNLSCRQLSG